jgi:hypothetical protein
VIEVLFGNKKFKKTAIFAAVLVFLGTMIAVSYLFDEEVSRGNRIKVGVFDLKIAKKDNPGQLIDINGAYPGEVYVATIPVTLIGERGGILKLSFKNLQFNEGDQLDPESKGVASSEPLWEQFYVSVNEGGRSTLKEGLSKTIGYLTPGETTELVIKFEAKTTLANEFQGDSLNFDLVFNAQEK